MPRNIWDPSAGQLPTLLQHEAALDQSAVYPEALRAHQTTSQSSFDPLMLSLIQATRLAWSCLIRAVLDGGEVAEHLQIQHCRVSKAALALRSAPSPGSWGQPPKRLTAQQAVFVRHIGNALCKMDYMLPGEGLNLAASFGTVD